MFVNFISLGMCDTRSVIMLLLYWVLFTHSCCCFSFSGAYYVMTMALGSSMRVESRMTMWLKSQTLHLEVHL